MPADLRHGDEGRDVQLLQRLLRDLNYYQDGAVDGDFGPKTEAAVRLFQDDYGLAEEGRVESGTWGALEGQFGPLEGMRDPDTVEQFVEDTYGTMNSSMDPADRLADLAAAGNSALTASNPDTPTVTFAYDDTLAPGDAYFNHPQWQAVVSSHIFDGYQDDEGVPRAPTSDELAEVLDVIYHELHHAEQWFEVCRVVHGLHDTDAPEIFAQMGVQQEIVDAALAAGPILECSVSTGPAIEWYESIVGGGSELREEVLGTLSDDDPDNDRIEEYRELLPEESDGWEAGGAVQREYREFEEGDNPRPHPELRNGSEGTEVGYLQQLLEWRQVMPLPGAIDNDFGDKTEASVKAFQVGVGLSDDGVVGDDTWLALIPS